MALTDTWWYAIDSISVALHSIKMHKLNENLFWSIVTINYELASNDVIELNQLVEKVICHWQWLIQQYAINCRMGYYRLMENKVKTSHINGDETVSYEPFSNQSLDL